MNLIRKNTLKRWIQVFRELEVHKVRLLTETNSTTSRRNFLTQFFYDKLNGSVNPIWLNEIDDLSTLEDNRIYLAIEKTDGADEERQEEEICRSEGAGPCLWTLGEDSFKRWIRQHHVSGRCDPLLSAFSIPRFQGELLPCFSPSSLPRMPKWRWTMMPTSVRWRRLPWA